MLLTTQEVRYGNRLQPRELRDLRWCQRLRPGARLVPGRARVRARVRAQGVRLVRAEDAVRLQHRPRSDRDGGAGEHHSNLRRSGHRCSDRLASRAGRDGRGLARGRGDGAAVHVLRPGRHTVDARPDARRQGRARLMELESYAFVLLRWPPGLTPLPDEEEALQAQHLAYLADLAARGKLVGAGPFEDQ